MTPGPPLICQIHVRTTKTRLRPQDTPSLPARSSKGWGGCGGIGDDLDSVWVNTAAGIVNTKKPVKHGT